ncbi:hypothetical protein [Phenylobacterium sp. 58.2.17]|jgi:hypothetical protein|uniref:hypothetical protein n=1 Tax=Phenylobacterium sp. 58.2.17 TaxID=2969306 RepID=UPI00226562E1|nr:hypothetical protein [Phenylobacterium sp. 58.2.17]MCX7586348.1 hypothetical protein [Phenylobacterium sp. 58.2.17]
MRTAILTALAALALASAPALAQDEHKAHHPEAATPTTMADMSKMTPEELHKHCSMMMGGKMQGTPKHDHPADKLGHAPAMKKPTEAEMKAMHDKCAAVMAAPKK